MFLEETFSNFSRKVYRVMWRGKAYKPELRAPLIWKMNHKMKIIREHQCHTVVYVCVWLCAHECMCLCFRVRMVNAALIPTHRSCSALGVGIFFFFEKIKKKEIYIFPSRSQRWSSLQMLNSFLGIVLMHHSNILWAEHTSWIHVITGWSFVKVLQIACERADHGSQSEDMHFRECGGTDSGHSFPISWALFHCCGPLRTFLW